MKMSPAKFAAAGAVFVLLAPMFGRAAEFETQDAAYEPVDSGLALDLQDMGQSLPKVNVMDLDRVNFSLDLSREMTPGGGVARARLERQNPRGPVSAAQAQPKAAVASEAMTPENSSGIAAWLDRHHLRGPLPAAQPAEAASPAKTPKAAEAMTPENSSGIAAWLDRRHLRDYSGAGAAEMILAQGASGLNFDGARPEAPLPSVAAENGNAQKALKINRIISQISSIRKAYEPKIVPIGGLAHTLHYHGFKPGVAAFDRIGGEISQINTELKGYLDLLLTPLTASTNGGSVIENSASVTSAQSASRGVSGTFFAHVSRSGTVSEGATVGGRQVFNILPPEIERVLAVKGLTLDNVEEYLGILEGRLRQNLEELTQLAGDIYKEYSLTETETVQNHREAVVTRHPWYFLGLIPVKVTVDNPVEAQVKRNKMPFRSSYGYKSDASMLEPFGQYAQQPLPAAVIK